MVASGVAKAIGGHDNATTQMKMQPTTPLGAPWQPQIKPLYQNAAEMAAEVSDPAAESDPGNLPR